MLVGVNVLCQHLQPPPPCTACDIQPKHRMLQSEIAQLKQKDKRPILWIVTVSDVEFTKVIVLTQFIRKSTMRSMVEQCSEEQHPRAVQK